MNLAIVLRLNSKNRPVPPPPSDPVWFHPAEKDLPQRFSLIPKVTVMVQLNGFYRSDSFKLTGFFKENC